MADSGPETLRGLSKCEESGCQTPKTKTDSPETVHLGQLTAAKVAALISGLGPVLDSRALTDS